MESDLEIWTELCIWNVRDSFFTQNVHFASKNPTFHKHNLAALELVWTGECHSYRWHRRQLRRCFTSGLLQLQSGLGPTWRNKSKAVLYLACPDGLFLSLSWQKAIQVFVSVWILQGLWPLDHQALIRLHWRRSSESKSVTYGSHRQAAPNGPLDV